jgi:hypothetical protein
MENLVPQVIQCLRNKESVDSAYMDDIWREKGNSVARTSGAVIMAREYPQL